MAIPFDRRDLEFHLYDVLGIESLCERERFSAHSKEVFDQVLDTAQKVALEKFLPHAAEGDENEPTWDGERVHIIPEIGEACRAFAEAGFIAAPFPEEIGGLQLPYTVAQAAMAMINCANIATAAYPMLTMAAANLLSAFGTEEQKSTYLPPMLEGRFFGTMCLSEPQAGSSLSDVATVATPADDGTYRIRGNKMWISGGEHELCENIIHLVLARTPDAPPGTKGISLFLVPRYLLNADGTNGEHNDIKLAGLNHKMGYRGTVNCVLNFGEGEGAIGWLVGELHQGLRSMFHMMNEARIGVGMGSSCLGVAGYRESLAYARERLQGRPISEKNPNNPPVPIIRHADVRRMLLAQKAYVEGALQLALYCAHLVDLESSTTDEAEREKVGLLLEILTPVTKAWPSEFCLEANKLAIQVLGGYGYTRDYPVERYYRENRLNPIHEGTNGIQAMDLLGRKVTMKQGAATQALLQEIMELASAARASEVAAPFAEELAGAVKTVTETTMTLTGAAMQGKVEAFMANASVYLEMFGHTVIAWMWLRQVIVAADLLDDPQKAADHDFARGKIHAAQFFYRWELPKIARHAELLSSLDDTCLTLDPDWL